jgi:two-component system chemotaxis response regulator CheB
MLLDKVRRARLRRGPHRRDVRTARRAGRWHARVTPRWRRAAPKPQEAPSATGPGLPLRGLVLIGVSTGGPRTLEDILPQLPAGFPYAVLVAQHMPANFTGTFAQRLDTLCALKVREVDGRDAAAGRSRLHRQGRHRSDGDRAAGVLHAVRLAPRSPEVLWHPSVDVLVDSAHETPAAAPPAGRAAHRHGQRRCRRRWPGCKPQGGRTIAESADTAVVFGMPQELIERGGATHGPALYRTSPHNCATGDLTHEDTSMALKKNTDPPPCGRSSRANIRATCRPAGPAERPRRRCAALGRARPGRAR